MSKIIDITDINEAVKQKIESLISNRIENEDAILFEDFAFSNQLITVAEGGENRFIIKNMRNFKSSMLSNFKAVVVISNSDNQTTMEITYRLKAFTFFTLSIFLLVFIFLMLNNKEDSLIISTIGFFGVVNLMIERKRFSNFVEILLLD